MQLFTRKRQRSQSRVPFFLLLIGVVALNCISIIRRRLMKLYWIYYELCIPPNMLYHGLPWRHMDQLHVHLKWLLSVWIITCTWYAASPLLTSYCGRLIAQWGVNGEQWNEVAIRETFQNEPIVTWLLRCKIMYLQIDSSNCNEHWENTV